MQTSKAKEIESGLVECVKIINTFYIYRHMPGHASREILILFGSLTSCDPGDVLETVHVRTGILLDV